MKTQIFKRSWLYIATLTLALTGCKDDEPVVIPTPQATCTDGIQNGTETGVDCGGTCNACEVVVDNVLEGSISADTTLDASIAYELNGVLSVESGATLTIPAGTKITAKVGAEATATYVVVQMGGKIDIQGTSANPVVMTSAGETAGDWGGLVIAGKATTTKGADATAEVGGIKYGGTTDTDSSGNIDYLVIEYAGAAINSESEFNGLTLYAVGSATTIDNVAITNGTDDGVEFFGGTVSASNFYLENNDDDAIDWTEGWNGTLDTAYVVHTIAGFSTVVEADGANGNPKLNDLTAVSSVGGTALQFKKASGATINGLTLGGYDTNVELANPDQGDLDFIIIDGASATTDGAYFSSTTNANAFTWADALVVNQTVSLSGSLSADLTLDPTVQYFLDGVLSVASGATLTIPAGTKITAKAGAEATATYVVVQMGGKIDIQGTASNPVVMTSAGKTAGDWGGLVIAGKATTTKGANATAEVGGIKYGGTANDDNSGSIKYLAIEYAGAAINSESEFNGLTLYAVGSATTIDNVAITNGTDDGVEFFGGTVLTVILN
jgi:urease beta subunit